MVPHHLNRELETFLLQRKKAGGGYGAAPKLPATIQDTYHALSIIGTLGMGNSLEPARDNALLDYLATAARVKRQGAKITFQMLAACRLATVAVDEYHARAFVDRRLSETDDLEERIPP